MKKEALSGLLVKEMEIVLTTLCVTFSEGMFPFHPCCETWMQPFVKLLSAPTLIAKIKIRPLKKILKNLQESPILQEPLGTRNLPGWGESSME